MVPCKKIDGPRVFIADQQMLERLVGGKRFTPLVSLSLSSHCDDDIG